MPSPGVLAGGRRPSGGGGGGVVGTFQTATGDPANATTYTFTSQPIGAAGATRRVVVAVANRDIAAVPTSVTIGGVSATMDEGIASIGAVSIWSVVVPTGTTATIVVTYTSANTYCGIGIWSLDAGSPVATGEIADNTPPIPNFSIATAPGDFVVAASAYRMTSGTVGATWTGVTERYDAAVDAAVRQHTGADVTASGATVNIGLDILNMDEAVAVGVAYRL